MKNDNSRDLILGVFVIDLSVKGISTIRLLSFSVKYRIEVLGFNHTFFFCDWFYRVRSFRNFLNASYSENTGSSRTYLCHADFFLRSTVVL